MPLPSSGDVASVTFTPAAAGLLLVTGTYDVQVVTGSDWGSNVKTRLACTQNSVTTYSDYKYASTSRQASALQAAFSVVAGLSCTFAVHGEISGAATGSWWNCTLVGELKKK